MRNDEIKITAMAHHRNGSGFAEPFTVVLFDWKPEGERVAKMCATVFDAENHLAVLNRNLLSADEIRFGFNSFSGSAFEPALRGAIGMDLQKDGSAIGKRFKVR